MSGATIIIEGGTEEDRKMVLESFQRQQRRDKEREAVFPGSKRQKMSVLCRLFPSLREGAIDPWDFDRFVLWALDMGGGSGRSHAIRFVLSVWNPDSDKVKVLRDELGRERPEDERDRVLWEGLQKMRKQARAILEDRGERADESAILKTLDGWFELVGPFNVTAAFAVWDDAHRDAFLTWAQHPFFP